MTQHYDLVVIGSGTAASVAATRCREAGWRVAVIDHLPFGGTCALRGCDPKKVLVGVAEAVDSARRMCGKGVAGDEPHIDWGALIKFKRSFTEPVPARKEKSFAESGIDAFHGRARFIGPSTVVVDGAELEGRFRRPSTCQEVSSAHRQSGSSCGHANERGDSKICNSSKTVPKFPTRCSKPTRKDKWYFSAEPASRTPPVCQGSRDWH